MFDIKYISEDDEVISQDKTKDLLEAKLSALSLLKTNKDINKIEIRDETTSLIYHKTKNELFEALNKTEGDKKELKEEIEEKPEMIPTPEPKEGPTPEPPETEAEMGIAGMLLNLIKDEWEAIDGYNTAIATLRVEDAGYNEILPILKDIVNEEMIHVGQLESVMWAVSPNAGSIEVGKAEAENTIADNVQNKELDIQLELPEPEE